MPGAVRRRALVVHASLQALGGAEVYAFRVIEDLQKMYDEVVVVHMESEPDLDLVVRFCDVQVDPNVVRFIPISPPWPRWSIFARWIRSGGFVLLRYAFVVRYAAKVADRFDLVVGTFAECPIRHPRLVQMIHIPLFVWDRESLSYCGIHAPGLKGWLHKANVKLAGALMGLDRLSNSAAITIANSEWTAEQFRRHYPNMPVRAEHFGVKVSITPQSPNWAPFEEREDNFVVLGRVVAAKRVHEAIEIVRRIRSAGYDVGLRIVGSGIGTYAEEIAAIVATEPWIIWLPSLDRAELERFVATQKWGLHCYHHEHYGFAPAELQALGCIAFCHDSGGQREVICDPSQRFADMDDAVAKILAVISSPDRQKALLSAAATAKTRHTTSAFQARFQQLVRDLVRPADAPPEIATKR